MDGAVTSRDIDVALQNQSLTLLALMAAHPMPHQALKRFRDLVDAWQQDPSAASLVRTLQTRPGRFPMNVDQVVQLLIPPGSGAADATQHMHDLFLMALLSTHTDPRRVSGQFRSLLPRLARSTTESALDPMSLVAVRRSAMRFDRIIQTVMSASDAPTSSRGSARVERRRSPRPVASALTP